MNIIIVIIIIILLVIVFWVYRQKKLSNGLRAFMYHHIGKADDDTCGDFFVSDETFARQLDLLLARGYHPVKLSEVEESYINNTSLPHKAVLLTFDDGYLNNYTYAYPIAREKGVPLTIFLSTGEINAKENMLTWHQVKEMHNSKLVEFASHGVNHKRLRKCTDEEVLTELTESKLTLETELSVPVRSFCYPYGAFDRRTRALVFKAGYIMDFGTRKGINMWPWKGRRPLLRAHVMRGDTLKYFEKQLKTGR